MGACWRARAPSTSTRPATPLFDKSRTLYLVDKAKGPIRKSGQAVIVEGYTDALMAHQAGFDNVVASLGTALTPGQVALLTRYAKKIALAYDVDAAGEKAGTFGATALEALIGQLAVADTGVELDEVRVVRLPDGKDPDEVVRETPDLWREEVRTAQPIVDYLIDFHARQVDLKTPGGKARFVDAIAPTLRAIPNPVMRDAYLQAIHTRSGIEERSVLEVLHRRPGASEHAAGRITADAVLASADALPVDQILRSITPVEEELLRLLLLAPEQQLRAVDELGPDQLPSTPARELFRAIVLQRAPNDQGVRPPFSMSALMAGLDDETRATAQAILARPAAGPRARCVGADRLRRRSLPAPARAPAARRAGRLGRWRDSRRGVPRRARGCRPAPDPPAPEQRGPSVRGSPDRTGNRVGSRMSHLIKHSSMATRPPGGTRV